MERVATRDCESVVPNRYELVLLGAALPRELSEPPLLAREPDRLHEVKTVTAPRWIAKPAANQEVLPIHVWRRRGAIALRCESKRSPVEPAAGEAQAA